MPSPMEPEFEEVRATGLVKTFGATRALAGVSITLRANWTAASRFGSLARPFRARTISSAGSLAMCSAVKLCTVRQ